MIRKIVFLIVCSLPWQQAFSSEQEEVMKGFIYRQGSEEKDLMYVQKETREGDSESLKISHHYFDSDEELEAFETVVLESGRIQLYETAINELDIYGALMMEDDRVRLVRRQKGEMKERNINYREGLIVGPMLPFFVEQNMETLLKGDRVGFYLPFFERMTLIPMVLEMKDKHEKSSDSRIVVEMKLKSRILSWLIDPVDMVWDLDREKIIEIHGPTILPDPRGGNSGDYINANIYYEYGGI
jgi:hypothetical protein